MKLCWALDEDADSFLCSRDIRRKKLSLVFPSNILKNLLNIVNIVAKQLKIHPILVVDSQQQVPRDIVEVVARGERVLVSFR